MYLVCLQNYVTAPLILSLVNTVYRIFKCIALAVEKSCEIWQKLNTMISFQALLDVSESDTDDDEDDDGDIDFSDIRGGVNSSSSSDEEEDLDTIEDEVIHYLSVQHSCRF